MVFCNLVVVTCQGVYLTEDMCSLNNSYQYAFPLHKLLRAGVSQLARLYAQKSGTRKESGALRDHISADAFLTREQLAVWHWGTERFWSWLQKPFVTEQPSPVPACRHSQCPCLQMITERPGFLQLWPMHIKPCWAIRRNRRLSQIVIYQNLFMVCYNMIKIGWWSPDVVRYS